MPGHDPSRPEPPGPGSRARRGERHSGARMPGRDASAHGPLDRPSHRGASRADGIAHGAAAAGDLTARLDELDQHIRETGHEYDPPGATPGDHLWGDDTPDERGRPGDPRARGSASGPAPRGAQSGRDPRRSAGARAATGAPLRPSGGGAAGQPTDPRDPRAARVGGGAAALSREERYAWREARRREAARKRRRRRMRWLAPLTLAIVIGGGVVGYVAAGGKDEQSAVADSGDEINKDLGAQTLANGPLATTRELGGAGSGGPVLQLDGARNAFTIDWKEPPRAGLVFDLDDGRVLWRKNPLKPLPIASVTKMMTALVVTDKLPPGQKIKITKAAINTTGSKVGVLPEGKWIGQSAMLHGLMLASGNDTAIALARQAGGGSVPRFVRMMNARAKRMGLPCTRYSSPSGLIDQGNASCAADLAVLARAVLDNKRLAPIVGRRQAVLPFPIKGGKLYLYNHNPLLKENYPGVIGVKTGYTDAAGKTFVAAVRHKGHRYGVVLLHSPDIKTQTEQLLQRTYKAEA